MEGFCPAISIGTRAISPLVKGSVTGNCRPVSAIHSPPMKREGRTLMPQLSASLRGCASGMRAPSPQPRPHRFAHGAGGMIPLSTHWKSPASTRCATL